MKRTWFAVCSALGVVGAGCSLFPSLDGLTGGSGDGGVEAAADAADAAEAGPWCATNAPQATFCDDFDEHPLAFSWAVQTINLSGPGTATLALDPLAHSPPNGVAVKLAANQAECTYGMLQRVFAKAGTHTRVAVDFRFGDASGDGGFTAAARNIFIAYHHEVGNTRCGLLLHQNGGSLGVQEQDYLSDGGAFDKEHPANGALALGRWGRFVIDTDFSVSPPVFGVMLDGAPLLTGETVFGDCAGAGTEILEVGLYCQDNIPGPTELRFDNFVLDTK